MSPTPNLESFQPPNENGSRGTGHADVDADHAGAGPLGDVARHGRRSRCRPRRRCRRARRSRWRGPRPRPRARTIASTGPKTSSCAIAHVGADVVEHRRADVEAALPAGHDGVAAVEQHGGAGPLRLRRWSPRSAPSPPREITGPRSSPGPRCGRCVDQALHDMVGAPRPPPSPRPPCSAGRRSPSSTRPRCSTVISGSASGSTIRWFLAPPRASTRLQARGAAPVDHLAPPRSSRRRRPPRCRDDRRSPRRPPGRRGRR